ncbi:MAG: hypothetical protein MUE81_01585 [Thermoflexibacter sp.]|nr:hypothetical protein [Thermoflexibacter sp.]
MTTNISQLRSNFVINLPLSGIDYGHEAVQKVFNPIERQFCEGNSFTIPNED